MKLLYDELLLYSRHYVLIRAARTNYVRKRRIERHHNAPGENIAQHSFNNTYIMKTMFSPNFDSFCVGHTQLSCSAKHTLHIRKQCNTLQNPPEKVPVVDRQEAKLTSHV